MSFMTLILCHRTSSVADVETSYFTQLKMCYVMTTFRCPSDILIMSWLFTARCSTWPGNHLVPCVAELVGSCIQIHAHRCLPDPKCLFLSIWSVAVPICQPLLPCPSRRHGSLPWHGLWWLTWRLKTLSLGNILQLRRVRSFYITAYINWMIQAVMV